MIVPAAGPLDPTTGGLHALYVSLNSPIVTVDGLPVGPASAAIAVHLVTGATLMIRSVRTGTVAFFHADPEAARARARLGPDAALAQAERLGFLFDEEATQGGAGLPRADWPPWLAEVFQDFEDSGPVDLSTWLSKFRWALAGEALARDADLELESADARDVESGQAVFRAQRGGRLESRPTRSEPQASEGGPLHGRGAAERRSDGIAE